MKKWICLACMVVLLFGGIGCKKKKPDPRTQPDFKDTTDPSKVMELPADPNKIDPNKSSQ